MSERILELTDATFDAHIADGYTLVDFTAAWCPPCHAVTPIVEQLAVELDGRVRIGKLDVDANIVTAMRYRVMSMPTFILFRNGQAVATLVGAQPKRAFDAFLRRQIDA